MKKHSNSVKKSESPMKRRNPRAEERRDSSEVMAELVSQLRQQLEMKSVAAAEPAGEERDAVRPNLDRLTVGVDLGDQWSNYCILGLGGETLREGQFRTRRQEVGEFFQGLAISRVVIEVGTHSAWVREVIAGLGHEVLVANAQRMEGRKRRRRKNDRIDAAKLARLGRVDPKSLYPIQHRSTEVREDLLVIRVRDSLVESRTKLISTVRGMVKTMGARVAGLFQRKLLREGGRADSARSARNARTVTASDPDVERGNQELREAHRKTGQREIHGHEVIAAGEWSRACHLTGLCVDVGDSTTI